MKKQYRNCIEINNANDFEAVADDILTNFLEDFKDGEGLTRKPDDDDFEDFDCENIGLIYTQKAMNLYERYVDRLNKLGDALFPDEILEIKSSMMIEL